MIKYLYQIAVILLLSVTWFFIMPGCADKQDETVNEQAPQGSTSVIEVFGIVKTGRQQNITIDFQATVDSILVIEGQSIKEGDPLIALNLESINAQIDKIEHELVINRLELDRLEHEFDMSGRDVNRSYQTLRNDISVIREELTQLYSDYDQKNGMLVNQDDPDIKKLFNDLEMAQQDLRNVEEELERKKSLFESKAIPKQELINLEYSAEQKRMAITGIMLSIKGTKLDKEREIDRIRILISQKEAHLDKIQNELKDLTTPEITIIEIQRVRVKVLEGELFNLKVKLDRSYLKQGLIISNVKRGIVTQINCFEGDVLQPGQKLVSIINLDSLKVEGDVPEEFIKNICLNKEVTIIPLAFPDREYTGRVVHISSLAVIKKGETVVPILIALADNYPELLPNFNVDIKIKN